MHFQIWKTVVKNSLALAPPKQPNNQLISLTEDQTKPKPTGSEEALVPELRRKLREPKSAEAVKVAGERLGSRLQGDLFAWFVFVCFYFLVAFQNGICKVSSFCLKCGLVFGFTKMFPEWFMSDLALQKYRLFRSFSWFVSRALQCSRQRCHFMGEHEAS